MINADDLEGTVLEIIDGMSVNTADLLVWAEQGISRLDVQHLVHEAEAIRRDLTNDKYGDRRHRVWLLAVENDIAGPELARQLARINEEETAARNRLVEIDKEIGEQRSVKRNRIIAEELLRNFRVLYLKATYEQKRELANALVRSLGGAVAEKDGLRWLQRREELIPWARYGSARGRHAFNRSRRAAPKT